MSLKRHSPGAALWAVLVLALVLRLAACFWWQSRMPAEHRFEFGDSEAYWILATHLAHGESYEYGSPDARIVRMPGYPLLLAAMFTVFGDDMPVLYARLLSALFGTAAVAAVYRLTTILFDRRTGLWAALVAACYPGAIAMSIVVLSEAPFCPLYLAQIAMWIKSWKCGEESTSQQTNLDDDTGKTARRRQLVWAVASGVLGGMATLVRPDWLLFVPFVALAGLPFTRRRGEHLKLAFVMSLAVAAVMAPWWWRSFQVVGRFVPTTLQVGASLYDGLNPRATGASDMWFVQELVAEEHLHPSDPDQPLEYRLDRRLRDMALDWAIEHPARVCRLAVTKFARMWNVWPNDQEHRGVLLRLVTAVTYVPALAGALVGIGITRRKSWPAALAWLPAVYLTLLHLIFVSSLRYREPPMLGLLVFTAAAITRGTRPSSAQ